VIAMVLDWQMLCVLVQSAVYGCSGKRLVRWWLLCLAVARNSKPPIKFQVQLR
jgi:hypothetical protein